MELLVKKDLFTKEEDYYNSNGCGFIERWDFSDANISHESRVAAVSQVASVCYGNNSLKPNFKLFDKLAQESIGLPSSSFEFVPVLLDEDQIIFILDALNHFDILLFNSLKYGYKIDGNYFITNMRALWYDLLAIQNAINKYDAHSLFDIENYDIQNPIWFNTEDEVELIRENVFTFRKKITIRDARQFNRHRISLQELSRRYTTSNKVQIDFRLTPKMNNEKAINTVNNLITYYEELLSEGIKAEEARDILPVNCYTTIWSSWYKSQLDNFINLRTKTSAQKEIRLLAEAMKEFIQKDIK